MPIALKHFNWAYVLRNDLVHFFNQKQEYEIGNKASGKSKQLKVIDSITL